MIVILVCLCHSLRMFSLSLLPWKVAAVKNKLSQISEMVERTALTIVLYLAAGLRSGSSQETVRSNAASTSCSGGSLQHVHPKLY